MRTHRHRRLTRGVIISLLAALSLPAAAGESSLREATDAAQQRQQAIQTRIDQADDETKALLGRLLEARESSERLERYNRRLAETLEAQQTRIEQQARALDSLDDTRDALPATLDEMTERLRALIEADMPFRLDERLARVESLERSALESGTPSAERLEQMLSAWRTELEYGREMDAWRGRLVGSEEAREVQYLRVGRAGFYYLTPDGQQGGVWRAADRQWQPLDRAERTEVGEAIRIARDQRSPRLLSLPLSVDIENASSQATGQDGAS